MTTETYRGVKIRTKLGKGNDWGYTLITINGHDMRYMERDQERLARVLHGIIDDAIERPDSYGPEWRPGHKGVRDTSCWQNHRCT